MTNRDNDLNDDLSDLLGGSAAPASSPLRVPPASYQTPDRTVFAEGCPKCRGTGTFISYTGRPLGQCFACKGAGKKVFSTSPESRAKAAGKRAEKRADKAASDAAWRAQHEAEIVWLREAALRNEARNGTFTFPASLLEAIQNYGTLTDSQLAATQKLMAKDAARKAERAAEREAAAPVADVTALEQAFAVARERAARPGMKGIFNKPLKLTHNDISMSISSAQPGSKWAGMLFVRDAANDDRRLGYFKGGKFFRQGNTSDAEAAAVLACAATPFEAVKAYAKAWSRCGVCGHTLLNDVSIEAGMGPICREKFGW